MTSDGPENEANAVLLVTKTAYTPVDAASVLSQPSDVASGSRLATDRDTRTTTSAFHQHTNGSTAWTMVSLVRCVCVNNGTYSAPGVQCHVEDSHSATKSFSRYKSSGKVDTDGLLSCRSFY